MRPGTACGWSVVIVLLTCGCAEPMSRGPLTPGERDAVRFGGTLHIVRAGRSRLSVHSPASTVLTAVPVVGIAAAIVDDQRGSSWARDYDLEEPAWSVKQHS